VKFIQKLTVTDTLKGHVSGYQSVGDYSWYAGI
jgi:hypothetical protein